MKDASDRLPPVIYIGSGSCALTVARCLGRRGVRVHVLCDADAQARFSRYARYVPTRWAGSESASWKAYLLGPESDALRGAVLLSGDDAGVELIAHNRDSLSKKYLLDDSNPVAQLCMLDKLRTYEAARDAGVPTPRYWRVDNLQDVMRLEKELVFPLLVKPQLSHLFALRFGKKYFLAQDFAQLVDAFRTASEAGISAMLVERIPGLDDQLCSYYTYLDGDGRPLFDFTKRIIRRYPINMGHACYHVTDWNPEVRELALPLFKHVGLRGLANVEFKRDERDGRLKLIECNARFTAANGLVAAAGLDLASLVYNRLTGLPLPQLQTYKTGLRLWYPEKDFLAYRQLRRTKEITFLGWLKSIAHPQVLPYFRWYDPVPSMAGAFCALRLHLPFVYAGRLLRRVAATVRTRFGLGRPAPVGGSPMPSVNRVPEGDPS